MSGNAGLGRRCRQYYKRWEAYLDPSPLKDKSSSFDRWQTLLPPGHRGREKEDFDVRKGKKPNTRKG